MGPRVLAITPEISQVGGPGLTHGNDAAVYLVHFGEHLAPCPVDVRLADGERFFLGQRSLQALHLPGHSPGSVAYVVESDGRRVVFAQDVHGPLHLWGAQTQRSLKFFRDWPRAHADGDHPRAVADQARRGAGQ